MSENKPESITDTTNQDGMKKIEVDDIEKLNDDDLKNISGGWRRRGPRRDDGKDAPTGYGGYINS